jgi:multiple sugar transport system permease protein
MNWTKSYPAAQEVNLSSLWQRLRRSDIPTAILFLLPAVVILSVFNFYPIAAVIRLSLDKWDNLGPIKTFIGLANYQALFGSQRFWNSMTVTFEYTAAVTMLSIAGGLVLAVLLNNRYLIMKSLWRSLYFLPSVTPTVAAAMVWMLIFNPSFGYVNVLLRFLGIQGPNWLADITWALPTLMLLGIWRRLGFNFIIYLAALQAIPSDYYESAEVDGANAWQRFLRITVPLMNPTTVMLVILGVIDSFLVFDQVMVLTRGGPANATEVIGFFMYLNAFSFFKMGYGAAISVVMFVVIAIFTLLQWRLVGFGRSETESV